MKLRIAHVTATFPPYRGGTGNVCYHNARELARRGHEVHVFTAAMPGAVALEECDAVTVHRLQPLLRVGNAPLLPGLLWALRGFDIVHLHTPFILGAEFTTLASKIHHIPLIVTYHNDLIYDGSWRDVAFSLATYTNRHLVLKQAHQVLFVSEGHAKTCDQRQIYQLQRNHCTVLSNGVDTQAFQPRSNPDFTRRKLHVPLDAHLIGFVGGLDRAHHYKGLNILLQALNEQVLQGAHLLVVGDGDQREIYQAMTQELGLAEYVRFYGSADHDALPHLYCACDVVTVPSLVAESFGLVVIEALACGVPVVASEGPGIRGLLDDQDDGILVPPGDAKALANSIGRILGNEAWRREMGARGREKVVAYYSWERIGEQLETVYRQCLDGAHAIQP